MRFRRTRDAVNVLNVTPLIDVVFILLVFFMLATNFASYRLIRVETPRETQVVKTAEGAIVVEVRDGGALTFDGAPTDAVTLDAQVRDVVAIDPGRVFLVRPFDGVPLQDAIAIYDLVLLAGGTSVSFSAPPDEGGGA